LHRAPASSSRRTSVVPKVLSRDAPRWEARRRRAGCARCPGHRP